MSLTELRSMSSSHVSGAGRRVAIGAATAPDGARWRMLVAIAVAAAAGLAVVVGTVSLNGDGVWHLVWGRALADGTLDSFATGPTPHPSLLVMGAAASVLGDGAGYVATYVLFGPLAFGVLAAAVFDVATRLSSRRAGIAAVAIVATSGSVVAFAGAARYDVAFAALVMTAVALELARPRRGLAPLLCLAGAGLVRPEGWILAVLYWLWVAPTLPWPGRLRAACIAVAAPCLWALMDLAVTGDPLHSLHVTDDASAALYGRYTSWENLEAAGRALVSYLGAVPLLLTVPAAFVLLRDRLRSAWPLLAALAVTLGLFLLMVFQGMASSERYLLLPVCALAVLAAIAVDGGGRRTRGRIAAGVLLAALLVAHVVSRAEIYGDVARASAVADGWFDNARALIRLPATERALRECPTVALAGSKMRPWFALHSHRAPAAFLVDGKGRTQADVFVAPANRAVADALLTRARFDDDASFRIPPGLRRGPGNADWVLYVSPASACARGLL
jgi:hypothetical protein